MSQNPQAWLLRDSAGNPFAVNEIEMVAYEQSPHTYQVPATLNYCSELLLWQQQLIPLLHTALLFAPHAQRGYCHIGIVAYQQSPGSPLEYLALSLSNAPHKIEVTDNTIAPLPPQLSTSRLRPLAISCFNHDGVSVPVLDIAYLASHTLRERYQNMAQE